MRASTHGARLLEITYELFTNCRICSPISVVKNKTAHCSIFLLIEFQVYITKFFIEINLQSRNY